MAAAEQRHLWRLKHMEKHRADPVGHAEDNRSSGQDQHACVDRAGKICFQGRDAFGILSRPADARGFQNGRLPAPDGLAVAKSHAEILNKTLANADVQISEEKLAKIILPNPTGAPRPNVHRSTSKP
jgi:hypothetical protein